MRVYCSYHDLIGHCTEEDYNDSKEGRNPSGMVKVNFVGFTQAMPIHTLRILPKETTLSKENYKPYDYFSKLQRDREKSGFGM